MFFLTPSYIKHGRQFLKDARKLLDYKRDLVTEATVEEVQREIGQLEAVLRLEEKEPIEAQMHRLDEVCGKLSKPHPDAGLRENVEVFLVAIVVALAVRTYFLQPFTIPTGSMQPTLNGIIGHPNEAIPNPLVQAIHLAWYGRTYVNVVAKEDESITRCDEAKRFFFMDYTRITTSAGNVYWVHAPARTVTETFLPQGMKSYKAGEPIVRGYIDTGDHVFVDKFSYNFRMPSRGEVFVFTTAGIEKLADRSPTSQFYIKRLAGLPGDTLRIDPPKLFLNGSESQGAPFRRVMAGTYDEPKDGYHGYSNRPDFVEGSMHRLGSPFSLLGFPDSTVTLGPKEYFALGDNSYHSADSRDWGTVPQQNIMGHGVFVYWPFYPHWGPIR